MFVKSNRSYRSDIDQIDPITASRSLVSVGRAGGMRVFHTSSDQTVNVRTT